MSGLIRPFVMNLYPPCAQRQPRRARSACGLRNESDEADVPLKHRVRPIRSKRDPYTLGFGEFFLVRVKGQEPVDSPSDRGGNMQDAKRTMPFFRRVHLRRAP